MGRRRPATTRRPDRAAGSPAVVLACLALIVQGLVWFAAGSRFLAQAGRIDNTAAAGFAGVIGLALAVPGAVALVAGVGTWRGWRRAAVAGQVMAVLGIAVAAVGVVTGVLSANPGVLLLSFLLGLMNTGVFRALRSPRSNAHSL